MWFRLRKTASRGREPEPAMRRRIRSWRLRRAAPRLPEAAVPRLPGGRCVMGRLSSRSLLLAADLAGLAGLPADALPGVLDALALVRLGLPGRPDAGGHLTDELLVDAHDGDAGGV